MRQLLVEDLSSEALSAKGRFAHFKYETDGKEFKRYAETSGKRFKLREYLSQACDARHKLWH
jgi:hypothetical protein